jgi:predicted HTH transcriptional regulator
VEFKESFFSDMNRFRATGTLAENPDVTKSALKSVAAFMNSRGGTLLLGVNDSALPCEGITRDLLLRNCNRDHFELTMRNYLRDRFVGVDAESHVSIEWADCEMHPVISIDVVPCSNPAFLRSGNVVEFFLRRGNRTLSLDFPAFYEHILGLLAPSGRQ